MDADIKGQGDDTPLLIQFTRSPRAGVKSRMVPALSPTEACDLHCELTLWTCRRLLASGLGAVELAVEGDARHPLFSRCLSLGVSRISAQRGADLGQRMFNAISSGLQQHARVLLVGSDCPAIDTAYLEQALTALDSTPVVLGPATDGGYVLIGGRAVTEEVFRDIPWGGEQVCTHTRLALQGAGLAWTELPALPDIDRPEDLPVWECIKLGADGPVLTG